MKQVFLFIVVIFFFQISYAQISTNETPVGYALNLRSLSVPENIITLPSLDMNKISEEDRIDSQNGLPPRFGYLHDVSLDINNSGVWQELPN